MKNSEKVIKSGNNWEKALHMKIYEAPHMNFGELRSPGSAGQYREAPAASGSVGSVGQRRAAFGNCGNKLKY